MEELFVVKDRRDTGVTLMGWHDNHSKIMTFNLETRNPSILVN